jgi:hypothetical protein
MRVIIKSKYQRVLVPTAAALLLGIFPMRSAEMGQNSAVLQVNVTIPPTPSATAESRIGDRFVDEMSDVFRDFGFTGKVERLDDLDKPRADMPVLMINLVDWSKDHVGNVNCRFSATLASGATKRALGSFDGMSSGLIAGPGRFGASRAFDDAAKEALRELFEALAKTDLVPGLHAK